MTPCRLRPYHPDDAAALWEAAHESVAELPSAPLPYAKVCSGVVFSFMTNPSMP